MVQSNPQFSPAQILEAGQRAATEGRTEYALQFFQHLVDHYAATPEAAAARESLVRLAPAQNGHAGWQQRPAANRTHPPKSEPGFANGMHGAANGHAAMANGAGQNGHAMGHEAPISMPRFTAEQRNAGGLDLSMNGAARAKAPANGRPTSKPFTTPPSHPVSQPVPAPDDGPSSAHARPGGLPAPEANYLTGRLMAFAIIVFGVLAMIMGLVLIIGAMGGPQLLQVFGLRTAPGATLAGPGVLAAGVVLYVLGQVARAVFDGVNALRDLALVSRLRQTRE